jgi:hypothetical protein
MSPSLVPCCLFAALALQLLLLPVSAIRPAILHEHIQRQVAASNGTSNVTGSTNSSSSSNGVSSQSGIASLQLASDKQCVSASFGSHLTLNVCSRTYFTTVAVGNISFRAALDTGSADLWLLSTGCADSACKSLPRYPLLYDSPSFVAVNNNNTIFNVSFADTTRTLVIFYAPWQPAHCHIESSGFVARETVQLASLSTQQAFGAQQSHL